MLIIQVYERATGGEALQLNMKRVIVVSHLGLGMRRLSKYFCPLFYSFILNALAYYSFNVAYYSHLCLQKK